jgi:hypothetical protein
MQQYGLGSEASLPRIKSITSLTLLGETLKNFPSAFAIINFP